MIESFKQVLALYILIPLVLVSGCYLTVSLKGLQFTHLLTAFQHIFKKNYGKREKAALSSFSALAAVLGGNLGTGNIAGIAVALTTGGPGALLWMWVMAFLGAIVKFVGCFLGVKYRQENAKGFFGGPMYYLSQGLKQVWLARLFCLFAVFAAFTVGNLVQVNSVALPLTRAGVSPLLTGVLMACLVGVVLLGGARVFAQVTSKIVPIMALIYLVACFYILGSHYALVVPTLKLIGQSALSGTSVAGGILGFSVWDAVRVGFDRGLFATDAGIGLAPILHAQVPSSQSKLKTAFTQGLISVIAPFIVMIICMITGMVLLVTGVWQITGLESTNMCIHAFLMGMKTPYAGYIVIFTLYLFAFTTILTWAYCAESAVKFLWPDRSLLSFKILFLLFVPLGGFFTVSFVWSLADISLNAMLLINLIGVLGLSREVVRDIRKVG